MQKETFIVNGDIYRITLLDPDPVLLTCEFKIRKNGKLFRKGMMSAEALEDSHVSLKETLRIAVESVAMCCADPTLAPEDECSQDAAS